MKDIVSWRFERSLGRDGQLRTYSRAVAVYDDDSERCFDKNDVVLCLVEDEEYWVAQVVRFCIDPSREDEEKLRVELRWMYYGEHMEEDTVELKSAKRPLHSMDTTFTEVAYSEHIDDYTMNSVAIITGKVFLYSSPEGMEEKRRNVTDFQMGDRHMICRTFYLHIKGKDAKGPVLRKLLTGELQYLLRNAGQYAMWNDFEKAGKTRREFERAVM